MAKAKTFKFKIIALSANDKAINWVMKLKSEFGLVEAKCRYKLSITIDEDYFVDKINSFENKIKNIEAKPDMFDDYKASIKSLKDDIAEIKVNKALLGDLVIDDFEAAVSMADFSKDVLTFEIPEDVINEIIKLRHDVEAFVVGLK